MQDLTNWLIDREDSINTEAYQNKKKEEKEMEEDIKILEELLEDK